MHIRTLLFKPLFLFSFLFALAPLAQAEISASDKIALKRTVVDYIALHTEADRYHFTDPNTLEVKQLQFLAMHPVLFEKGDGSFALCADFATDNNDKFLVDYHVTRVNNQYVVSAAVEGKRSLLMSIADKFSLE